MTDTPRLGIPRITGTQANDFAAHIDAVADAVDAGAAKSAQGLFGSRPAAGTAGRYYWSTDRDQLDYDNGTRWHTIISNYWNTWSLEWGAGIGAEVGADFTVHVDSTIHS